MKAAIRATLLVLAAFFAAQARANAQDLCIPLVTCIGVSPGSGSGSGAPASAPEISSSAVAVGVALVGGIVAMMPRRRKASSTRISDTGTGSY